MRTRVDHNQYVWHATYIQHFSRIQRIGLQPSGKWGDYVFAHRNLLDFTMMYPYSLDYFESAFTGGQDELFWDALLVRIDTDILGRSWFSDPLHEELFMFIGLNNDVGRSSSWWRDQFLCVEGEVPASALKFYVYATEETTIDGAFTVCEGSAHLGAAELHGVYRGGADGSLSLREFSKADFVDRMRVDLR